MTTSPIESGGRHETWEERETAERTTPDPERLDAFIGKQLSDSARKKINLALR